MVALFVISGLFALICYCYDPKYPPLRWMTLLLACASSAGLSRAIIESFIPILNTHHMNFNWLNTFLYYARIITGFFSIYFCPWGVLMHAIVYSERFSNKTINNLNYILFTPIIIMIFTTTYVPDIVPDFKGLFYWGVPYIITGYIIHLYSYFTESDPYKKKTRFITFTIMHPIMLSALILNYIVRVFDNHHEYWRYVIVFMLISFSYFIWRAFKQDGVGSMNGIKIKYEKQTQIKANKAILTGVSLMNHAIKNQIFRIVTGMKLIKENTSELNHLSAEGINMVDSGSDHLLKMVEKINSKTQDITIVKKRNNLTEVVDGVISELEVEFIENHIVITKEYLDEDVYAFFDKTPTKEVFLNMFKNAIEAIEKEGIINVRINKKGKKAVVIISDNGIGITKENLEYVKSPFFTTKKLKDGNTGWGLYYCYDVMVKSDGNLEISSQVNVGTDIKLTFSTKR